MAAFCPKGHPLREVSRDRVRETVEDVVYVIQKIKKFNREGAENMETVKIPEFVERAVDVDLVRYACDQCGSTETVRENPAAAGP
jgi:uncharacterized UBP type Zn finger protein